MNAPPVGATNPFPGLRPFREDEEELFFGREAQVDSMVDTLRATHFLAVVGTSGSGKSSLVNCGLIPALHRGLMDGAGSGWRVATLRPGNRPMRALAEALARPHVLAQPAADGTDFTPTELIEATLTMSKLGLVEAFREALPDDARPNLLVVVDQFEELFRYQALALAAGASAGASAAEQAIAFVTLLLEVATHPELRLYVVLTMRSDFLGECAQFTGLPEAINRGQYLVPRMTRDQRRAAIAGPLAVRGADIDPVLLTRLVNDVGDNPDQLSILQHALNRTWARWREEGGTGLLGLRHYEAIGAMAHALNQHADEAYAELADGRPRALCEAIFKAITDKSTDVRGTRRPARVDTLCAISGATVDELAAVLAVFRDPSRAFIMPPDGAPLQANTPIDISHESLMRVWDLLRTWGDEEARSAQMYRRLAETADLHTAGAAGLWGEPDLQGALAWKQRQQPNAAWAERYRPGFDAAMAFLEASDMAWEAKKRADEEEIRSQQEEARREEEDAARVRQQEARQKLNSRWRNAVVVMLVLGVSVLAIMFSKAKNDRDAALKAQEDAVDAQRQAENAQRQAEKAQHQAEADKKLALEAKNAERRTSETQKTIFADASPQLRQEIEQLTAKAEQAVDRRPLVYLQYSDDRQKALADQLRGQLNASDYSAPGIEKVSVVPAVTEIRYFRPQDESAAAELAGLLGKWDVNDVRVKFVHGYAAQTQIRQFEIWLARPNDDLDRLFQSLTSATKDERVAAAQTLQTKYASSPAAIALALGLLAPDRIDALSADGRMNLLYFLTRTAPAAWSPSLELLARKRLAWAAAQEKLGAKVGDQTRAELTRLTALLDEVPAAHATPTPAE